MCLQAQQKASRIRKEVTDLEEEVTMGPCLVRQDHAAPVHNLAPRHHAGCDWLWPGRLSLCHPNPKPTVQDVIDFGPDGALIVLKGAVKPGSWPRHAS